MKINWPSRIAFLLALIITVGLVAVGCVSGLTPIGWSGGTVSNGFLYIGSQQGRMVSLNLTDDGRVFSEALAPVSNPGLFGCSSATAGGGCSGGAAGVPVYGTPVVSGNLTYMAGYNGKVYAYNTSNLAVRWVYPREGNLQPFVGGLAVLERPGLPAVLFIGSSDGKVYALDAELGDRLWESAVSSDKIWGTPTAFGDTLYIGSFDKILYALNVSDGTKKWEYPTGGSIVSKPLIYQDTVIFGSFDRNLYALNATDGSLKWQFTGQNWFWAEPVLYNGKLYVGCLDKFVYVLDPSTGVKIAEHELDSAVASTPVVVGDSVIFASEKGIIYAMTAGTYEVRQLADLDVTVNGPLAASGDIVYIHTQANALERVNAVTGALLTGISLQP